MTPEVATASRDVPIPRPVGDARSHPDDPRSPSAGVRFPAALRRRGWTAFLLAVALFALSSTFDPSGYLSTDVGGKTASVATMAEEGRWNPGLEYWFADHDPDGRLFPQLNTVKSPNGSFVNTTSLTMVLPARPVWALGESIGLGGHRAILVFPIAGAVATALAAGELERRIRRASGRPSGDGHRARWVVGLASPVTVYALDFWEHALGLAAMAWAYVAVLDVLEGLAGPRPAERSGRSAAMVPLLVRAVAVGLGFGLAATMRQEAMVFGFVAGVVVAVVGLWPLSVPRAVRTVGCGVAMVVGFVTPIALHFLAEVQLTGGGLRAARAAGTAGASGSDMVERAKAVLATTIFPFNADHPLSYVLGFGLTAALLWWVLEITGDGNRTGGLGPASLARAFALAVAVVLVVFGIRFVPGLVPTTPLALAGLVAGWRSRARWPVLLAVLPLPLVFAVQFPEGALVQWAGRYLLVSGLLLSVTAIAVLGDEDRTLPAGRMFAVLAVAGLVITAYGVGWRAVRAHRVLDDWAALDAATGHFDGDAATEPVVVWGDGFKSREAGPRSVQEHWLVARTVEDHDFLGSTLADAGVRSFYFVWPENHAVPDVPGFTAGDQVGHLDLMQSNIWRYRREAG